MRNLRVGRVCGRDDAGASASFLEAQVSGIPGKTGKDEITSGPAEFEVPTGQS